MFLLDLLHKCQIKIKCQNKISFESLLICNFLYYKYTNHKKSILNIYLRKYEYKSFNNNNVIL